MAFWLKRGLRALNNEPNASGPVPALHLREDLSQADRPLPYPPPAPHQSYVSLSTLAPAMSSSSSTPSTKSTFGPFVENPGPRQFRPLCRVCVLTVEVGAAVKSPGGSSDLFTSHGGSIVETTSSVIATLLRSQSQGPGRGQRQVDTQAPLFPFEVVLMESRVLTNPTQELVQVLVTQWCDNTRPTLILVMGGCGLGSGNVVPGAVRSVLTKDAPLLAAHLLQSTATCCGAELLVQEELVVGCCGRVALVTLPSTPTSTSPSTMVTCESIRALALFMPRLLQLAAK